MSGEGGRRHQAEEEGGRADHVADALRLDGRQRRLRVPALHQHRRHPRRSRHQHRVEQSRHVGEGRRHQHGVVAPEAVHAGHEAGLVGEAPLGVEHRLGLACRPRGEQDHGQVGGPAATVAHRSPRPEQARKGAVPAPHGDRLRRVTGRHPRAPEHQPGLEEIEDARHLVRSPRVVEGRGHGAEPPAGPVQQDRLVPVGELPRHHVRSANAPGAEAARQRRHPGLELGAREADRAVDETDGRDRPRREHGVERG